MKYDALCMNCKTTVWNILEPIIKGMFGCHMIPHQAGTCLCMQEKGEVALGVTHHMVCECCGEVSPYLTEIGNGLYACNTCIKQGEKSYVSETRETWETTCQVYEARPDHDQHVPGFCGLSCEEYWGG